MPNLRAHISLEEYFPNKLNIPVTFIYGDNDWMKKYSTGAENLISKDLVKGKYINIENCSH